MGLQGSESSQFKFFWVTKPEPDQVPNLLSFPVRISYASSLQLRTPNPVLLLLRWAAFRELRLPQKDLEARICFELVGSAISVY